MRGLVFGLMLSAPAAALAADAPNPSFYLVNRSTQPINEVYVRAPGTGAWGQDRLGNDTVDPGGNKPIRLLADGACVFDLRVVYDGGQSEERRAVNTCAVDNIAFDGPSQGGTRPGAGSGSSGQGRPAAQNDPSFRVVNRGDLAVRQVYASPVGASVWGRDRLGGQIGAQSYKVIRMPQGQCIYDVKLVFEDGSELERRRLNLCEITDLPVP